MSNTCFPGFSSVPSTSTSGGRRPLTSRTVDGLSTAGESTLDAYLANVDDFIGANSPKRGNISGGGKPSDDVPLVHFSDGSAEVREPFIRCHMLF